MFRFLFNADVDRFYHTARCTSEGWRLALAAISRGVGGRGERTVSLRMHDVTVVGLLSGKHRRWSSTRYRPSNCTLSDTGWRTTRNAERRNNESRKPECRTSNVTALRRRLWHAV